MGTIKVPHSSRYDGSQSKSRIRQARTTPISYTYQEMQKASPPPRRTANTERELSTPLRKEKEGKKHKIWYWLIGLTALLFLVYYGPLYVKALFIFVVVMLICFFFKIERD
jgi:hypothetical protein